MRHDARKKYPWQTWQDGNEHTVTEQEAKADYRALTASLYQRARRSGTYVNVTVTHNAHTTVTFQFTDTPAEQGHTTRDTHTGRFDAKPDFSHLPPAFRCKTCDAPIRPEWPNQLCHTKTDDPTAPNVWKSTTGALFTPKHEATEQ